eukprot:5767783-Heterocapsa_arctica.AAC.1
MSDTDWTGLFGAPSTASPSEAPPSTAPSTAKLGAGTSSDAYKTGSEGSNLSGGNPALAKP